MSLAALLFGATGSAALAAQGAKPASSRRVVIEETTSQVSGTKSAVRPLRWYS
jgi:hypothetical protein